MSDVYFDTMSAVTRMADAGMPRAQAEAVTTAMREAIAGGVATKADFEILRADIERLQASTKADIEMLQASTKAEIDILRAEIDVLHAEVKADIEKLQASTKADIEKLQASTKADFKVLKNNIHWMQAIGGFILAFLIAPLLKELLS